MAISADTIIGRGVLIPFRRRANDIVSGRGGDELRSSLRQLLLTQKGELRWRPDFGVDLDRFRHQNFKETTIAEIQEEILTAIAKYEPRVEILGLEVRQIEVGSTTIEIRLQWRAVSRTRRQTTTLGPVESLEMTV